MVHRLRLGAAKEALNDILKSAEGPLRVGEIHARLEGALECAVSRHTVTSFLSVACRSDGSPVRRVGRGRYEWNVAGIS